MEDYKIKIDSNRNRFCDLVKSIFINNGFTINNNICNEQELSNDFSMHKGTILYYVFIKYFGFYNYRTHSLNMSLESIKDKLKNSEVLENNNKFIIVTNGYYKNKNELTTNSNDQFSILDIENLLYLVSDYEELKIQLLGNISFSIAPFEEKQPLQLNLFNKNKVINFSKTINYNSTTGSGLIKKLKSIQPGNRTSIIYESVCFDILNYLFADDLFNWKKQQKSNDDLYRFDVICRIKDTDIRNFWKVLQEFFTTKYIVFEFKNYSQQITQKEIYTTDRYLYTKALRSVAIIISRKGASDNAMKAIKGTLRENGKLIISLNDSDLIEMIQWKIDNRLPSDYLYELLDNMLIELEK